MVDGCPQGAVAIFLDERPSGYLRAIDSAIDRYNEEIIRTARDARKNGRDWYVLDLDGVLDRLASRRYIYDPTARPEWWRPYDMPQALRQLTPEVTSKSFASGPKGSVQGGIVSLDGVHPTTIGYGIVAQECINVMRLGAFRFTTATDGRFGRRRWPSTSIG